MQTFASISAAPLAGLLVEKATWRWSVSHSLNNSMTLILWSRLFCMLSAASGSYLAANNLTDLNVPLCAVSTLAVLLFLNLKKPPMEGSIIKNLSALDLV